MNGHLKLRHLGESFIYPGHPVVLALCVVWAHKTYEEAFAPTEYAWPFALGNSDVPGAGGCVYSAMDLLKRLRDGVAFEEAVAFATQQWATCDNNETRYPEKWKQGQEQADRLLPLLQEQAAWWAPKNSG